MNGALLPSVQYAARLIRDCDDLLAGSSGSDPLSRYTETTTVDRNGDFVTETGNPGNENASPTSCWCTRGQGYRPM